ncbi:PLP-dependent transferase [Coniophora puteana RWD-64-598 SS2]|uniref:PLP-dependent transferase n=1 Tax=Coniophora puteana (strain RWD-64-598) TaxID=741705 RepID=R7SHK6_CONPW|nr:PLP-dependent transferase [Coniophora puteana RWD-64-598 SS2]EIW74554.1 PLP-dependent transferase [Coniophora puteana RWD-64-598 SS2]
MASSIGYKLSGAIRRTITPPVPTAKLWAARYAPTPARPLLDMSQGAPGHPPHPILRDAIARTTHEPSSHAYAPVTGLPALRGALADEMKSVYGSETNVGPEDIAVTAGANLAFFAAVMTLAQKGDEVILPVPWYFNHYMTLTMLGIAAVPLQTLPSTGFLPSPKECEHLISPRTRAIVLVSPNNPTGAVYPPSLIASFAALARRRNVALILDETYRDFAPSPPHTLFASASASSPHNSVHADSLPSDWNWRSYLLHIFSFSKAYAIPGARLGALVGPPPFLHEAAKALDTIQIGAPRAIQAALASPVSSSGSETVLAALRTSLADQRASLEARHATFARSLPASWAIGAQGGYFAFVRHPFEGVDASTVCERLARECGVVSMPAAWFVPEADLEGTSGDKGRGQDEADKAGSWDRWIRFSVANVEDAQVRDACARLGEAEGRFEWRH